jgi:hypothetical protein
VPAAADGDLEVLLTGNPHGVDDVSRAAAPDDHRWPAVDEAVVDAARVVVATVAGQEELAAQTGPDPVEGAWTDRHRDLLASTATALTGSGRLRAGRPADVAPVTGIAGAAAIVAGRENRFR